MSILQKSSTPRYSTDKKRKIALILLPLLTLAAFALSIALGSTDVDMSGAFDSLFSGDKSSVDFRIVFYIRLPRALGALLAGSALAVSGIIIQAVLNNPMAAPNIIGVNAGAGLFTIISMAVLPSLISFLPIAAFLGAVLAALIIYAISALGGASKITVTLVGVAIGSILTAGINTVKTLFPDSVYDVSGFLIGGMQGVDADSVLYAATLILPSLAIAVIFSRRLDVLSLGEDVAIGLGISVARSRILWLMLAAVLAGAAVSFAGLIGFVGLIVPHIMRRLAGNSHRYLVPISIFGGGIFLLVADTASRVLFAPYEIPVGILLSLIGGPFFIFLILAKRREKR